MRIQIVAGIAILLLTGGITMVFFGVQKKKYNCSQPEYMCNNYDRHRVVNCLTYPDGCAGKCPACLLYNSDYTDFECLPFSCDSSELSSVGIVLIAFGMMLILIALLTCLVAYICCRNQREQIEQRNVINGHV